MGLKREMVRGQPLVVGEHEIVPEAVVWSWQRKDVTLKPDQSVSGYGVRWTWARPTALLDRAPEQTYRVPVVDRNRQLELWLLAAALVLPILLNVAVSLLQSARRHTAR